MTGTRRRRLRQALAHAANHLVDERLGDRGARQDNPGRQRRVAAASRVTAVLALGIEQRGERVGHVHGNRCGCGLEVVDREERGAGPCLLRAGARRLDRRRDSGRETASGPA